MKISSAVLGQYTPLPDSARELRDLLDDVGLEVKKLGTTGREHHLTIEFLANRGDHHCYEGMAREIAGRTGQAVTRPDITSLHVGTSPVELRLQSDLCHVYTLTLLERSANAGGLSPELLSPLIASGTHSVSAPVDATNLSNTELGQPTHAFDADAVEGAISIRLSRAGEMAWPLFAEARVELPEGTLIIADENKVLAIAGVIGCEESKTTDDSTRVLVESACFDPIAVRKASRALDIHTDSTTRFERGSDPTYPLVGAGRVAHLLQSAGWQVMGHTGMVGEGLPAPRLIHLSIPAAASFLEHPLVADEVRERLERYGFRVSPVHPNWNTDLGWQPPAKVANMGKERLRNTVLVRVPPHRRWDVGFVADLYEELAKSIGYNNTPERLPPIDMGSLPSAQELRKAHADEVLVGAGFYEVITDGFYGRDVAERFNLPEGHPLGRHVETLNALDRGYSLLKNNCLAQALDTVAVNLNMRAPDIKAYEWTRTFHLDSSAANGLCSERKTLWAVVNGSAAEPTWAQRGRAADAWFLRGLVEELSVELDLDLRFEPPAAVDHEHPICDLLHPGRTLLILRGDQVVGALGEVHPQVVKAWRIKRARPCYMELSTQALLTDGTPPTYVEPTSLHPMERSLAFTLRGRVTAGEVAEYMRRTGPEWLRSVRITDRYDHDEDGTPCRTITYQVLFDADQTKRTAEEANAACDYLVRSVEEHFAPQGVKQR